MGGKEIGVRSDVFFTFYFRNRSATEAQSSQRIREISHKWTRINL
ncbi:MAG: hypothetical protein AB1422_00820 [bacterium]